MAARRILTLLTSCTALVSSAVASPRSDPTTGRAVFTGASMPSPTSITLNPAAIGLDTIATKIYVALTSTLNQVTIDTRTLDPDTGALSLGPSIRDTRLGPGGELALLWHPNDRLTLGASARLPPPELHPKDHDELAYHTLGNGQRSYQVNVGVSLRPISRVLVGASVAHENSYLHLRYARDTALERGGTCDGMPCGLGNPAARELYDVDVSTPVLAATNLRVNVGAVARLWSEVWLAVAYHTPPGFDIQSSLEGSMTVTRAPRDGGGVLRGNSTVLVQYPASVDAEVRGRLPEELELHVGGRWEDLSRMTGYDVRGYGSTFVPNGVPEQMLRARGMHDSFAVWAGIEQLDVDVRKPFRFGARVGYETAAVSERRLSPMTVAPAAVTIDLGVQARIRSWVVQLSYGIAYSPTISVPQSEYDPRHRLDCIDSDYDYTSAGCRETRTGYALPTAAGDYRRIDHALRLGFRYELP